MEDGREEERKREGRNGRSEQFMPPHQRALLGASEAKRDRQARRFRKSEVFRAFTLTPICSYHSHMLLSDFEQADMLLY